MAVGLTGTTRSLMGHLVPRPIRERLKTVVPRKYLVESVVSKENRAQRLWRRHVLRKAPVLYHLDVHVTDHCNLNCRGCEHYSSISEPFFASLEDTVADLERMADLFSNIEQIYLLGGEPLLHPDVEGFVRETRRIFPRTRLYLMTNGVLVARMPGAFWRTLHGQDTTLLCDSYPINIPADRIDALGQEYGVRVEWMKPAEEFFKIPLDVTASCDPRRSFAACRGISNCAIVRDGRLYPCAHSAYVDILQKRFNIEGIAPGHDDSISIRDGASGDRIIDFLTSPTPWCAHCDFDSLETYPWARGKGEVCEWLKESKEVGT